MSDFFGFDIESFGSSWEELLDFDLCPYSCEEYEAAFGESQDS